MFAIKNMPLCDRCKFSMDIAYFLLQTWIDVEEKEEYFLKERIVILSPTKTIISRGGRIIIIIIANLIRALNQYYVYFHISDGSADMNKFSISVN